MSVAYFVRAKGINRHTLDSVEVSGTTCMPLPIEGEEDFALLKKIFSDNEGWIHDSTRILALNRL
jgi:hypothetical protein